MNKRLCVYVDVDETFVRNYGTKRIPMPEVISHICNLKDQGVLLYCWSSGGSEYAKKSAREFGIEDCFEGFLPKPHVILDDQSMESWRSILHVHPNEITGYDAEAYLMALKVEKK